MDEQLRRRSVGAPAARSLLLTVLGEYVLARRGGVWQETLVTALVSVGYTQQASRQAVSRSTRDGWLSTERRGRRARMSLAAPDRRAAATGAERIYSFGRPWEWDGRWLVVVLRVPGGAPRGSSSAALAPGLDRAAARSAVASGSRPTSSARAS